METLVKSCGCFSLQQDKMYGSGMRLHNVRNDPKKDPRCTVCGRPTCDKLVKARAIDVKLGCTPFKSGWTCLGYV